MNTTDAKPQRLLRLAQVMDRCGLGKTAIYERIRKGLFPKPADLGGVVAWSEAEIDEWIAARLAERSAHPQPGVDDDVGRAAA